MQEMWVWSLHQEDPLEKEMATCSSSLAVKTLWTEEPGGIQFKESQWVRHNFSDWAHTESHVNLKLPNYYALPPTINSFSKSVSLFVFCK